jgi:hypothetical protein
VVCSGDDKGDKGEEEWCRACGDVGAGEGDGKGGGSKYRRYRRVRGASMVWAYDGIATSRRKEGAVK